MVTSGKFSLYKLFGLDQSNWYELLYTSYLIIRPTIKFKVVTVLIICLNVSCCLLSSFNFVFTNESTSQFNRLLVGDLYLAVGTDGSKAICISAMMGSFELLNLQIAWLYRQLQGETLVERPSDRVFQFRNEPVDEALEWTKKFALFQVTNANFLYLALGVLTIQMCQSVVEVALAVLYIVFWLAIVYVDFSLFSIHAGFWLQRMKKWQQQLQSINNLLIQFESSMSQMNTYESCRTLAAIAIHYVQFKTSFSKVNCQLSFYVRLLGFTSIFYTCGLMYMTLFVENFMMKCFAFAMNALLAARLLLIQVTSVKITKVNNRMYLHLTRMQARANLKTGHKCILLNIIQQIGFPQKPSLALEASSDGSAFVSLSIYSYIEKVALFFLPLVTSMHGMSNTSIGQVWPFLVFETDSY